MKALAIDSAVPCISLAACNQQKRASITLDIGMRQSEKLIPAIEYVLEQIDLPPSDLDFIALSGGPGSFTGLRLGFAAAKGLQFSTGCPVYSIPTLEAQALPYSSWPGVVVSAIDAKKDRFYVQFFSNGKKSSEPMDAEIEEIVQTIGSQEALIVGPDSLVLHNRLETQDNSLRLNRLPDLSSSITDALFSMAQKAHEMQEAPLEPHQGPIYLRKSEAEENQR